MNFVDTMIKAAKTGNMAVTVAQERAKQLTLDANRDGGQAAKARAAEATAAVEANTANALSELNKKYADFCYRADRYFAPEGSKLTPDSELLKDGLPRILSEDELKIMGSRYQDNTTMSAMLVAYWQAHYPETIVPSEIDQRTSESVKAKANTFLSYCCNAVTAADYLDILTDETKLSKIVDREVFRGL